MCDGKSEGLLRCGYYNAVFIYFLMSLRWLIGALCKAVPAAVDDSLLRQQLLESETLVGLINETWEDKLVKTRQLQETRMAGLRELGIVMGEGAPEGSMPLGVCVRLCVFFLLIVV